MDPKLRGKKIVCTVMLALCFCVLKGGLMSHWGDVLWQ